MHPHIDLQRAALMQSYPKIRHRNHAHGDLLKHDQLKAFLADLNDGSPPTVPAFHPRPSRAACHHWFVTRRRRPPHQRLSSAPLPLLPFLPPHPPTSLLPPSPASSSSPFSSQDSETSAVMSEAAASAGGVCPTRLLLATSLWCVGGFGKEARGSGGDGGCLGGWGAVMDPSSYAAFCSSEPM